MQTVLDYHNGKMQLQTSVQLGEARIVTITRYMQMTHIGSRNSVSALFSRLTSQSGCALYDRVNGNITHNH